ncbi:hypothetical protein LR48_Vigan10g011700 [Vigna angularis]|uniref:Ubiquitin-like protease family profile domain-containing protein n=1 Tax=Phaseolus angularis TaxID=3914 RepID=A0A0L9VGM7_PHAAN|nr:hypothetical protein LR48_Vigan10g011700 [Vigna angularis]
MESSNNNLWAYERLGLHDDCSAKEFPRVQFDWYLSENDCLNPIIRRAFNLDEGLRREGSKREEKVAENEYDENWLLATLEKLRTNNAKIRKVRDEIAAVRKVLGHRLKYRKVEQSPSFHEQPADEKHEEPADEEDEQPADDKPASTTVEEEERVPLQHPQLLTDIGDGVHHGEGDVVLQPFCSGPEGVGDVEGEGNEGGAHVDEENEELGHEENEEAGDEENEEPIHEENEERADEEPTCTMVVEEEGVAGDHPIIVIDVGDGVDDGEGQVDVEPLNPYFRYDLVRLQGLLSADWVFIPIVSDGHWWCYALKVCTFQFYVIDSLANGIKGRCRIDRSIAQNIQRFWGLLTDKLEVSKCALLVEKANIPVQPNTKSWLRLGKRICDWILDEDNVRRLETLQHFGLL